MAMTSLDRRHLLAALGAGLIATPRVFAGSSAEQIGTRPKASPKALYPAFDKICRSKIRVEPTGHN